MNIKGMSIALQVIQFRNISIHTVVQEDLNANKSLEMVGTT